jgi:ankyrin repeat protein
MPVLSSRSTIDTLRRDAKSWLKSIAEGDSGALERFRRHFPRHGGHPRLREVQQALARDYGFGSWAELKQEIEDRARTRADTVALFLEKSVNRYGTDPATRKWGSYETDGPSRGALAARLLARHPGIARENIHTAVAAHDVEAVRRLLSKDPGLARSRSAFDGWPPLSRLAYARLPIEAAGNALEIAERLIDAGADPNAGWTDQTNDFTPLVGVIGRGEGGQAPHPQAPDFARLLIARGADPFAPQALYNLSLGPDSTEWLDYLWSESEKRGETAKWTGPAPTELGGDKSASALAYLLGNAVPDHIEWVRWLLDHGADARGLNFYSREPVIKHALLAGREDMVGLLLRHGAEPPALSEPEALIAAIATQDRATIIRLARARPNLLENCAPIFAAIRAGQVDIVETLLDLGMSPDLGDDQNFRALHLTTHCGAAEIARLLIGRGAEIDPFERRYGGTPLTHACYHGRTEMVSLLAPHSRNFRGLCFAGEVDRLRELLTEEPDRVHRQDRPGETALFCLPEDQDKAVDVAELLLSFGADPRFRDPQGHTPAQAARRRGLDEAADLIESFSGSPAALR